MVDYEVGDLAWAKMKGFSPWPAMIVEPDVQSKSPKSKERSYYVRFFGTNDHSWIVESNLFSYEEHKDKYGKKNVTGAFKRAIQEIFSYAEKHPPRKRPATSSSSNTPRANGVASPKKSLQVNNKKLSLSKAKSPKTPQKRERKESHGGSSEKKRRMSGSSSASSSSNKGSGKKSADKYSSLTDTPPNSKIDSSFYWKKHAESTTSSSVQSMGLLKRPSVQPAEATPLDFHKVSNILRDKNIEPTQSTIGFLGLGIMGQGIVKNLIHSHHKVVVWDQTPEECSDFVALGATKAQTPGDVVKASNITFSCLADPEAAKNIVFSSCGVLQAMCRDKGYVEMTSIDPDNSQDIADAITQKEGKYLEAPILGSRKAADDGTLNILAAGDRHLFDECRTCFQAMGERIFYLGDVGKASLMNLVVNMLMGATCTALAESMAFALRSGISQRDVLEILNHGALKCPAVSDNGKAIIENLFNSPNMPLQQMQKNLRMALDVGDQYNQFLPTISAANEVFKHAKNLGYGLHDVSAVYMGARF